MNSTYLNFSTNSCSVLPPQRIHHFKWQQHFTERQRTAVIEIMEAVSELADARDPMDDDRYYSRLLEQAYKWIGACPELGNKYGDQDGVANRYNGRPYDDVSTGYIGDFWGRFNFVIEKLVSFSSRAIIGDYETEAEAKLRAIRWMVQQ